MFRQTAGYHQPRPVSSLTRVRTGATPVLPVAQPSSNVISLTLQLRTMTTSLSRPAVFPAQSPVTSSHPNAGHTLVRQERFRFPGGKLRLGRKDVAQVFPARNLNSGQSRTWRSRLTDLEEEECLESDAGELGVLNMPADVVILTNGPGEVATWVKPVLAALRRSFPGKPGALRVSVVLAPCPHASGGELNLIRTFTEVDRCQGPEHFWRLLLLNRTAEGWDWHKRGVCIFLGGDQFSALLVGKRLGYRTIVYAEDAVRWPGLVDMYALRTPELLQRIPNWLSSNCKVVGDLFSDAVALSEQKHTQREMSASPEEHFFPAKSSHGVKVLGLLPGSKDIKLSIGVPYFMAVADLLCKRMGGDVRFLLPLAPTVSLDSLAMHADRISNPFIARFNWSAGTVKTYDSGKAYLVTEGGIEIQIQQQFPSYEVYKQCWLCLTTVGTNTAELGSLGIPMIVVLPTHALEVFRGATGGFLGLLASLPGRFGDQITRMVNMAMLRTAGYIAWPNRWAGEEIVPELIGLVEPEQLADAVEVCLSGDRLQVMHSRLCALRRGVPHEGRGAANQISKEVLRLLSI